MADIDVFPTLQTSSPENNGLIEVACEAIVIVDIVQATETNDLFGWYAVGRSQLRILRELIIKTGSVYGLGCIKSTGDGYLLSYRSKTSASLSVVNALESSRTLLQELDSRNRELPDECRIHVRIAIHFGEVDVLSNDREGPTVSYAFRLEATTRKSLRDALNPIESALFPLRNYVICSESVHSILMRSGRKWEARRCGLFKLKGIAGWSEIYLISDPE